MATLDELLMALAARYRGSGRVEKTRILDEFASVTGHHRKHAMRLLRAGRLRQSLNSRPERRVYHAAVREALIVLWEASDRICGKRLKAMIPTLLPAMERHGHLDLAPEIRVALLAISAATIDRVLAPQRERVGSGTCQCRVHHGSPALCVVSTGAEVWFFRIFCGEAGIWRAVAHLGGFAHGERHVPTPSSLRSRIPQHRAGRAHRRRDRHPRRASLDGYILPGMLDAVAAPPWAIRANAGGSALARSWRSPAASAATLPLPQRGLSTTDLQRERRACRPVPRQALRAPTRSSATSRPRSRRRSCRALGTAPRHAGARRHAPAPRARGARARSP